MTTERDIDGVALTRLSELLDAYGGAPERWPDEERDAALALLARSTEARALRDQAARLDALLDRLPAALPSPGLEDRIVAAARREGPPAPPARRIRSVDDARARRAGGGRRRGWLVAAMPLAAAAALGLWLRAERPTDPATGAGAVVVATSADDATGATGAGRAAIDEIALADLGSYATPGDALLDVAAVDDVYDAGPWDGCNDGELGCIEIDTLTVEPVSQGDAQREKEVRVLS
jgi:hypothetical protein